MAEIQSSSHDGESAARFIEFVMMQAQNASLFLGLIPNPQSGQPEVNLELARMFIDQLAMIDEKTRGNLSSEESKVLRNALTHLQMAFFEVSQGTDPTAGALAPVPDLGASNASTASEAPTTSSEAPPAAPTETSGGESKKRFSKSYGS